MITFEKNSKVEGLFKSNDKCVVIVRHTSTDNEEWYQEDFDAVLVANGHYAVPNIAHIEGLANFNELNPDILIHYKSYRSVQSFKDNKVLIVGGSFNSANILQYVVPLANKLLYPNEGHILYR